MIQKIFVANRGECAVRILRTCRDLGLETILGYSEADQHSLGVELADHAVCLGPAEAEKSYLNIDAVVTAAAHFGADAIHPGYGFLAENPELAMACEAQGLRFVGPSKESLRLMGDKLLARKIAQEAGIPVLPGSSAPVDDERTALRIAGDIGYPLLLKATAGGGGRGMRRVEGPEELTRSLALARGEAQSAFGNGSVYLEALLPGARHVEIQFAADAFGEVQVMGERDCTIQRRFQKLVEEAPSPSLVPEVRESMAKAAETLVRHIGICNVGTVEFLYDPQSGRFFFLEMNPRLQVEHTVTEMVTGIDLVEMQIRIASGERLPSSGSRVKMRGHAIEFRINAEDPHRSFFPSPGKIETWRPALGPFVRVDTHLEQGREATPYYDSLIAKLIVYGRTRDEAIARSRRALAEFEIGGVRTTIPLYRWLLDQEDFLHHRTHTGWIQEAWQPQRDAKTS